MPLGSSSATPVINPGPRLPSRPLCAARLGAAQGDAGRQHGNRPVISVEIGHWPAAAGVRARVFRGLRHLIRLLIDTVLDLRTLPAIPQGAG